MLTYVTCTGLPEGGSTAYLPKSISASLLPFPMATPATLSRAEKRRQQSLDRKELIASEVVSGSVPDARSLSFTGNILQQAMPTKLQETGRVAFESTGQPRLPHPLFQTDWRTGKILKRDPEAGEPLLGEYTFDCPLIQSGSRDRPGKAEREDIEI